jgi:hypothetical protein
MRKQNAPGKRRPRDDSVQPGTGNDADGRKDLGRYESREQGIAEEVVYKEL